MRQTTWAQFSLISKIQHETEQSKARSLEVLPDCAKTVSSHGTGPDGIVQQCLRLVSCGAQCAQMAELGRKARLSTAPEDRSRTACMFDMARRGLEDASQGLTSFCKAANSHCTQGIRPRAT